MNVVRLVVLFALFGLPGALFGQKRDSAITIGRSYTVWSDSLQEQRRVFVYLPYNYDRDKLTYPVVYLLDGDVQFQHVTGLLAFAALRLPETIVVAVTNTHRTKDLTPATSDRSALSDGEDAGGAPLFLDFMTKELKPWAESHFRIAPYSVLIGHSYSALFAAYALLNRPEAFNAYIMVSPSLWWDKRKFIATFGQRTPLPATAPTRFVYLSSAGQEPEISEATESLVALLKEKNYPDLDWHYRTYPDLDHGSTPHLAIYDALRELFKDRLLTPEIIARGDPAELKTRYAELSRRHGYEIKPSPNMVLRFIWAMGKNGKKAEALQLAEETAAAYPYLSTVLDTLGACLEEAGRFEDAEKVFKHSMEFYVEGETTYGDPVSMYRDRLARLEKKIADRNHPAAKTVLR